MKKFDNLPSTFSKPRGLPRESIPHRIGAGSILRERKVLDLSFVKVLAYGFVAVSIGISIAVIGYLLTSNK